jgi:Uma2 family endonuclease
MPLPESEYYTYYDYASWPDDVRYELIEGIPYAMSPSPSRVHQDITGSIYLQLRNFLKGKQCKAYIAPFDVRLNADEEDDTVLQPDVLVVCDDEKLDNKGLRGAPDIVFEVLSPSTAQFDLFKKYQLYQRYGVKEYWIVNPESRTVTVHTLQNGKYASVESYTEADTVPVKILDGLFINLAEVFSEQG